MHCLKPISLATLLLLFAYGLPSLSFIPFPSSVAQAQMTKDKQAEAEKLLQEAIQLYQQGKVREALTLFQKTMIAFRELGNRNYEAWSLVFIGLMYANLGQSNQALDFYQQALTIQRDLKDREGEGTTLNNIGLVYYNLGKYEQALEYYQQALAIHKEVGNRPVEGTTLNNIGLVYYKLGKSEQALDYFQQALAIHKEVGNRPMEGTTLNNIGEVYRNLGKYEQALEFYRQALAIFREVGNRAGEGTTFNNIGLVSHSLGKYEQTLDYYQQALAIHKEVGNRPMEGTTLNNIAIVYQSLGKYQQSLDYYQQALTIHKEVGNRPMEGTTLNNIGLVYDNIGKYEQALEFYQQALAIFKEVGNRAWEGTTLNNIGVVYYSLEKYEQALDTYQQALAISKEVGNRPIEGATLHNIGYVLASQNQPEVAIIFFKHSVNTFETIRADIRGLPKEEQESYTKSIEVVYRKLSDLLLSQGRILEAQQVLELLKLQEIRDYTRYTRATEPTAGIALSSEEAKIIEQYGTLIALGSKIEECQKTRCSQLSQLNDRRDILSKQYTQIVHTFETEIAKRRADDMAFLDPNKLPKAAKDIVSAQPKTVLISTLVLEDKLWILWASEGGITKTIEITGVGQKQLSQTVLKFRQLLQDPNSNLTELQTTGKQLYDWLIPPSLQKELKDNQIQNLVFSLDSVTRYIPISALYDGKQYLVENYAISTIISAELTDTRDRLPRTKDTNVLALGLSNAVEGFKALPNVPKELDAIVIASTTDTLGIYWGTQLLDRAFTYNAMRDNLYQSSILHIATHGEFVPGSAYNSYLVLGDGSKMPIPDIESLRDLGNVHLVVLSACETALGGGGEDGKEIAGISYYFLNGGAKAVMASLWQVDDESTRMLMEQFYSNLAKSTQDSPITKAQAIRQAQLSLLGSHQTATDNNDAEGTLRARSSIRIESRPGVQTATNPSTKFSHPYYWAAFILIGNGL